MPFSVAALAAAHGATNATVAASLPLTFTPSTTAVAGNVYLSALVGASPLIAFFALLGGFKIKTHRCALLALALAAVLAMTVFKMPVSMTLLSASQGLAFAVMPMIFIVVGAVWLYNLTEFSNRSQDLRAVFSSIGKADIRIQALIVAYTFCNLLEGLAGFGAPVAITCAMLATLGLPKIRAVLLCLLGNLVYLAYGAMATPVLTAGRMGGVDPAHISLLMGRLIAPLALVVPFLLLLMLDGRRGVRQLWPLALVTGVTSALGHLFMPLVSFELTGVATALFTLAATYIFLLFWTPTTPPEQHSKASVEGLSASRVILALTPYLLVVTLIATTKLWKWGVDLDALLKSTDINIPWPGLYGHLHSADGSVNTTAIYQLPLLSNPGTPIIFTAIVVTGLYAWYGRKTRFALPVLRSLVALWHTISGLRYTLLTIAAVMALAYVMNFSGQTTAIGAALASTGHAFTLFAPILGWLGTAVGGSTTSSGALFGSMEASAAHAVGTDAATLLASNTVAGGIGKLVSPQNLAVAATAVEAPGIEATVLRKIAPYSLLMLLAVCLYTFAACSGWLDFYLPHF